MYNVIMNHALFQVIRRDALKHQQNEQAKHIWIKQRRRQPDAS